jgi:hypothetical protein
MVMTITMMQYDLSYYKYHNFNDCILVCFSIMVCFYVMYSALDYNDLNGSLPLLRRLANLQYL